MGSSTQTESASELFGGAVRSHTNLSGNRNAAAALRTLLPACIARAGLFQQQTVISQSMTDVEEAFDPKLRMSLWIWAD